MKKIIKFFQNWFEKNGILKILIAFVLLTVSVSIGMKTESHSMLKICGIVATISTGYIVLTMLIFTIAGVVNLFKDMSGKE